MKYLSFDVGIKNLAYCCIDENDKTISQWGILNLNDNNFFLSPLIIAFATIISVYK